MTAGSFYTTHRGIGSRQIEDIRNRAYRLWKRAGEPA
nr:DUF2934 domain-containing protein [Bradyrhizobium brasilense]